ncbi:general transcription factor II-I repeat domain-containing protein 2B-like [Palaemon carinicauda]|uniref:general transcription factor II-I repeat domain-containing protein 2B-like n=1 Tax=Palaemon carinicauda TaxID=392227 RepID=UPI0035B5D714
MLKRTFDLLEEIKLFIDMKGTAIPDLRDKEWRCDLAFLVDITDHLSALNVRLQGKDQLVNEMFSLIKGFEIKLRLWESQFRNKNPAKFPTLKNHDTGNLQYQKYGDKLAVLREEFSERFVDLKKHSQAIKVCFSLFFVDVTALPKDMQMEIIKLQCNDELRQKLMIIQYTSFIISIHK